MKADSPASPPASGTSTLVPGVELEAYRDPSLASSLWQLITTLVGFGCGWIAAWKCLPISYGLTLLLAIPTAGLLLRLFVLAHDCGHGSFFRSKLANDIVGCLLGVVTLTPYHRWRKHHAIHHATSGNLDRRGNGDILMYTVREYLALTPWQRFVYRIYRHPVILFGIGPTVYFVILQRLVSEPKEWKAERRSVHWTNLALLVAIGAMCWAVGPWNFLLVHLPIVAIASSVGVWLFYVQHHYEHSYWKHRDTWSFVDAGLQGSSYYRLPKLFMWFSANIGLHHIHHLDSHIPNYRLQACMDAHPNLQAVHRLTFWESLSCARLRLWDEDQQCMVRIGSLSSPNHSSPRIDAHGPSRPSDTPPIESHRASSCEHYGGTPSSGG